MDTILTLLGTAGLAAAAVVVWRGRGSLRETTLAAAWGWLTFALLLWGAAWIADVLARLLEPALADQVWYLTAVLMLCPLIAVLGARRPGARVWAWFVLLPLVLVLSLPALSVWGRDLRPSRLELDVPPLLGYAVVLVMGAGNYFATRFTLPVCLYAAAPLLLVAPYSTAVPDAFPAADRARMWGTLCITAALLAAARQAARSPLAGKSFDRLWSDFRDWFGIVWARRIQERVNDTARREQWPLRLEMEGLVWVRDELSAADRAHTLARLDHTFRWLLRRFVDPPWIDRRLP